MDRQGAMGTAYDEILASQLASVGVTVAPGASGYFAPPESTLDPNLFVGLKLKSEVRMLILKPLLGYLEARYSWVTEWLKAWLAGSGASYQWAAERDPGDLDILLTIDHVRFRESNPEWTQTSDVDIDTALTQALKRDLWPSTAHTQIGGSHYEVTYYVNPGHEDIREINPYAAYRLTQKPGWTVQPIRLPSSWDPVKDVDPAWWAQIAVEQDRVRRVVDRYHQANDALAAEAPGTPRWLNAIHRVRQIMDEGAALFDELHSSRRRAFGPGGKGYLDYYNFRWQSYKRAGLTKPLHEMAQLKETSQQRAETAQYGAPISSADDIMRAYR